METYKQLHSILRKDGKNYAVDLVDWAQQTLSGSDLDNFNSDLLEINSFFEDLENRGELTRTPVTTTLKTSKGEIIITVAMISVFTNTRSRPQKYDYWETRFSSDPNVTYNTPILQQ